MDEYPHELLRRSLKYNARVIIAGFISAVAVMSALLTISYFILPTTYDPSTAPCTVGIVSAPVIIGIILIIVGIIMLLLLFSRRFE
jgi:hypothetical protein